MDTIIRTHVKNQRRLDDLEREIVSWKDKGLWTIGDLYLVDDGSPLRNSVKLLAKKHGVYYRLASGSPDTKNGLACSLQLQLELGKPCLHCVDDAVFGRQVAERLVYMEYGELPKIPNYSMVGTFACYEDDTRLRSVVPDTGLWRIDYDILYALVGHVFSNDFAYALVSRWEQVKKGTRDYPQMCDDIWAKLTAKELDMPCYNTLKDYTQHIGMNNRTFGDNQGSEYESRMFVGE